MMNYNQYQIDRERMNDIAREVEQPANDVTETNHEMPNFTQQLARLRHLRVQIHFADEQPMPRKAQQS